MRAWKSVGFRLPVVMCFVCLFAAGCGGGGDDAPESATRAAIRRNRQTWQSRNISSIDTRPRQRLRSREARGPVRIDVRDGVPVFPHATIRREVARPELFASSNTINKLFDRLNRRRGRTWCGGPDVRPRHGYPSFAYIAMTPPRG
jgi:hypothetical protein